MRTARPHPFDMQADKPQPLIRRRLRLEVPERIDALGNVIVPVDPDAVRQVAAKLIDDEECDSIAICFLFSFRNPLNEKTAAKLIRDTHPYVSISCSSEITREWREFERTSTTVVNALCRPAVDTYVSKLAHKLAEAGFNREVRYMQSNGGLMSADETRRLPVRTILSGPVGAVVAAQRLATVLGEQNVLTLDIGGTTADMALLTDYKADHRVASHIHGWPILFPAVDIRSVGAGGGSIAFVDSAGAVHVGPNSAGAYPGPVCYSRGGVNPTVTDADVALGVIDPEYFLGGALALDRGAAVHAIDERIARPLGLSVADAARGVVEVVDVRMAGALREISVNQGHDVREFTLFAFGGAGGMHASALARELEIPRVVIPANPAVFSAMGMLMADLRYDAGQTVLVPSVSASPTELADLLASLERVCMERLDVAGAGSQDRLSLWTAELRYRGQDHQLSISIPAGVRTVDVEAAVAAFEARHERAYGYRMNDEVLFVTVRATTVVSGPSMAIELAPARRVGHALKGRRIVQVEREVDAVEIPVYDRAMLGRDEEIVGPAIVEEAQSTVFVATEDVVTSDRYGNLFLTISDALTTPANGVR
jgi:N-methylhydantoinase A